MAALSIIIGSIIALAGILSWRASRSAIRPPQAVLRVLAFALGGVLFWAFAGLVSEIIDLQLFFWLVPCREMGCGDLSELPPLLYFAPWVVSLAIFAGYGAVCFHYIGRQEASPATDGRRASGAA